MEMKKTRSIPFHLSYHQLSLSCEKGGGGAYPLFSPSGLGHTSHAILFSLSPIHSPGEEWRNRSTVNQIDLRTSEKVDDFEYFIPEITLAPVILEVTCTSVIMNNLLNTDFSYSVLSLDPLIYFE